MKVFLDMDGTLNVWESNAALEYVMSPGYMRQRTPHKNIIQAAKKLQDAGAEIHILSAYFDLPHSIPDKNAWLDEMAPFIEPVNRHFVVCGTNKAEIMKMVGVNPGDVFIDDYNQNLYEVEHDLGALIGCIKCVHRGTNDMHRSWHGARVFVEDRPEQIVATILHVGWTATNAYRYFDNNYIKNNNIRRYGERSEYTPAEIIPCR